MKKIFITQKNIKNPMNNLNDCLDNNYINFFEKLGILPIIIPNSTKNLQKYFELFKPDGIILSGGEDVNPDLYGGEKHKSFDVSELRDNTEFALIDYAVKNKLPLLGICRGFQIINVYFGGKLIQKINELESNKNHLNPDIHTIVIDNKIINQKFNSETFVVNSFHNQGVDFKSLSNQLKSFAVYKNTELIEAFYHINLPILAVQWHPERQLESSDLNVFLMESILKDNFFWL